MCILEKEELTVVSEEDLKPFQQKKFKVTKTGKTTGQTTGYIHDITFSSKKWFDCYSISKYKSDDFSAKKWFDCYSIFKYKSDDFSKKGDSGSGVFLVEKDETQKPLGILLGGLTRRKLKIVCKIDTVLDKLGLKIVRYAKRSKREKYWNYMLIIGIAFICITIAALYDNA